MCLTQNNLSGQLWGEELAVENIVRSLATVQQPLRRLGGRWVLMTHISCHSLRSEDGGRVETDMLLFPIIKGHLWVINLNGIISCQSSFPREAISRWLCYVYVTQNPLFSKIKMYLGTSCKLEVVLTYKKSYIENAECIQRGYTFKALPRKLERLVVVGWDR